MAVENYRTSALALLRNAGDAREVEALEGLDEKLRLVDGSLLGERGIDRVVEPVEKA
ncbi:hypothetical protein [Streptomyces sp. NPDC004296]|uniref:hypothetical protein n=1 Tax=Streptomyces sp. NPDC004296 TaxID=3364697 RepID=UPI0036748ACC